MDNPLANFGYTTEEAVAGLSLLSRVMAKDKNFLRHLELLAEEHRRRRNPFRRFYHYITGERQ